MKDKGKAIPTKGTSKTMASKAKKYGASTSQRESSKKEKIQRIKVEPESQPAIEVDQSIYKSSKMDSHLSRGFGIGSTVGVWEKLVNCDKNGRHYETLVLNESFAKFMEANSFPN